jgi:hypothetical protein
MQMFPVNTSSPYGYLDFSQELHQSARKQYRRHNKDERNGVTKIEPEHLADEQQDNNKTDRKCARDAQCCCAIAVFYPPLQHPQLGHMFVMFDAQGIGVKVFENTRTINRTAEAHSDDIQDTADPGKQKYRRNGRLDSGCYCVQRHVLPFTYMQL